VPELDGLNMALTPFCNETEWEEKVKELSREVRTHWPAAPRCRARARRRLSGCSSRARSPRLRALRPAAWPHPPTPPSPALARPRAVRPPASLSLSLSRAQESLKRAGEDGEDARTSTSVAAKTLCIPHKQPPLPEGTKCFVSGKPATCWVLWGRSY
jgi:hypothetical protein